MNTTDGLMIPISVAKLVVILRNRVSGYVVLPVLEPVKLGFGQ
jgi:hypothetical protein